MKTIQLICLTLFLCALCGLPAAAQKKLPPQPAANSAATPQKVYKNIVIEKFTIKEGVEFERENLDKIAQRLVASFQKSKRFDKVTLADSAAPAAAADSAAPAADSAVAAAQPAAAPADDSTLRLSGEIILYKKGSQGGRYLLGPFGGQKFATRLVASIVFVDAATNEKVLQQSVDGVVSGGFFGGDEDDAKGGLTGEIVKVAKKNFSAKNK